MDTEAIASRTKDCSKGFCSLYCPQWCYIIFPPPPPPPPFEDFSDDQTSGQNFSPIVLTIIGFLAGALLLVSYYAIISKYCRNRLSPSSTTNDRNNHDADVEQDGDVGGPHSHEPWFMATNGLDEALIRSIKTFEYRRGEGLVEGTECSVCLSEFVEEEPLRLLPKCSHAFHVHCIDTWLECHSNCPLCRANVAAPNSSPPPPSLPLLLRSDGEVESSHVAENLEIDIARDRDVEDTNVSTPKTPRRDWQEDSRRDDEGNRQIRRSVSMDFLLCVINHDEDCEREESSRQRRSRENECEMRPIEMRSYSSGRWFVSKWGKANAVIPF